MTKTLEAQLEKLADKKSTLYNKDFLLTWQQSDESLRLVGELADALRDLYQNNRSTRLFDTGLGISIFRDNSTRTRYAFRSACNLLGLMTEELDEGSSQIAHGETVRETATMISFLTEVIGIRDDIYLGYGHSYMTEVSHALDESFKANVIPQRPSVINLQCDLDHPTQSLCDLQHLKQYFGGLDNLRGKKLAMTWAHSPSYGKPLSVPQGIIGLMTRYGMNVVLAHPKGYELVGDVVDHATRFAKASGGSFDVVHSMDAAFENADIVYPKSWAPMVIMEERAQLRKEKRADAYKELEKKGLALNAQQQHWETTEALMAKTKQGKALYMHCLPADITGVSCAAGEVSASVFERYRLDTYREASYKPYVVAAMILATRWERPGAALHAQFKRAVSRRG